MTWANICKQPYKHAMLKTGASLVRQVGCMVGMQEQGYDLPKWAKNLVRTPERALTRHAQPGAI